jgi:hypothetical protein
VLLKNYIPISIFTDNNFYINFLLSVQDLQETAKMHK